MEHGVHEGEVRLYDCQNIEDLGGYSDKILFSHQWDLNLSHNCSNTILLTHCTRPGIKLAMPQRQAGTLTHYTTVGTLYV